MAAHQVQAAPLVGGDHVLDRLEREVRVDGTRAEPDQQRHVVHLARVAALDDQAHLRARLLTDEMVVDRTREQQRRDRCVHLVGVAVREHDDARAARDRITDERAHVVERRPQSLAAVGDAVQAADHHALEVRMGAVVVDVDDLGEIVVVDDGERQLQLTAAVRSGREQVRLGADAGAHGGDDLLADGVERRVRHLCEQLLEVVEQETRTLRQHRNRRVGAHGTERLAGGAGHRRDDDLQLLLGVAEHLLAAQHAVPAVHHVLALGEIIQVRGSGLQPVAVRVLVGERELDLLVVDDAPLLGVDQEHAPRLQTTLADDAFGGDVEHACFAREHDQVVVRDPVSTGSQAVAVENRADDRAVGEAHVGRTVPWFHERCVVAVEGTLAWVHAVVVLPRLGDHHQQCVRQ